MEKLAISERAKPGKFQLAWTQSAQICRAINAIRSDRNAAAEQLRKQNTPWQTIASSIPKSKIEAQAEQTKRDFFTKAAAQRWTATVPQRKKTIEALYQQLLTTEGRAGR